MKFWGAIFVLTILIPLKLYSQDLFVKGKTLDKATKLPISDINVSAFDGEKVLGHTISDSTGSFKIHIQSIKKNLRLKFFSINYDEITLVLPLDVIPKKNYVDVGSIEISTKQIQLKEVTVKARKRYRDTTKINLSDKKFERSVMITDLFSTNGFYKDPNGLLYYNGKLVSDILVNGGSFFGKNNMNVYNLLPALALDNIEVIETNIDSLTNTTTLRPTIKINLRLKEKYNNGKFGNLNSGLGTETRYMAGADLYTYKRKQQIIFGVNSNNINISDLPPSEPVINFSANGNNSTTHNTRFSYNNTLSSKFEISLSIRAKLENKKYTSDIERKEESIDQFSKIINKSDSKLFSIPDVKLTLNYKIDSVNNLSFTQTDSYNKTDQTNVSNYEMSTAGANTASNLHKTQNTTNRTSLTELSYSRRFTSKAGRLLNITVNRNAYIVKNYEIDTIYNLTSQNSKSYFIKGDRNSDQSIFDVNSSFTEPLGTEAYINVFFKYEKDKLNYQPQILSDSLTNIPNSQAAVANHYYQAGANFHKVFRKISLDASVASLFNVRNNLTLYQNNQISMFNVDIDLKMDYKINEKKGYSINYKEITNYPEADQLINVNNSFDLISQTTNSLDIKPEIKHSLKFDYRLRKSDLKTANIFANFDYYTSKYGQNIAFVPNAPQNISIANIGNAKAATLGVSLHQSISDNLYLTYTNTISYQEQPTIFNNNRNLNNGLIFNQTLSTDKELLKKILTISPILTAVFSKYYYQSSSINVVTLTYSDKFSFNIAKFRIDLYPLINYNHNIGTTTSFSMNGAVKKSLFKNYGVIWIQGYDLFNSFKFDNNYIGSSYIQTVKYSNTKRYVIAGISIKFNNIK